MERLIPVVVDGKTIAMVSIRGDDSVYLLVKEGVVRKSILMDPSDFNRMFAGAV
jgi:hypothetical protein